MSLGIGLRLLAGVEAAEGLLDQKASKSERDEVKRYSICGTGGGNTGLWKCPWLGNPGLPNCGLLPIPRRDMTMVVVMHRRHSRHL